MSDYHHSLYTKHDYRATITFNRPEVLNAVNWPMLHELNEALRDAARDVAASEFIEAQSREREQWKGVI